VNPSRRRFVSSLAATAFGAALLPLGAVEPFPRPGRPRLKLALAAYSFRDDFKSGPDGSARTDMFRFLDYCAEQRCDAAELTSYYFPENATDDYFARVRRHAHLRGVAVSGTAVGNDFCHPPGPKRDHELAHVKAWIARAAILGAPHIRVFAGDVHGNTPEQAKSLTIEALEECAELAGRHGILLGIENHGGIVRRAEALVDIVKAVKSPWVGINLDTGNFYSDDPYREIALCAPWAVNVQFKGKFSRGGKAGAEKADVARTFKILRDARYQGYVALEFEFEEDPWIRVPQLLDEMRPFMG
jgi:sugar phosphate isomerase/epimerase